MTAAVATRRRLNSLIVPTTWTTLYAGQADTTTDGAGSTAKAIITAASPASTIELRLVTQLAVSPAKQVTTTPQVVQLPPVDLPAGTSTVKIEARTIDGLGTIQIIDTAVLAGNFPAENAGQTALSITAYDDITVNEGSQLLMTPPTHNGDQIYLERNNSGDWVAGGAFNKTPADPADAGTYRWRATRDGEPDVTVEFTVTVTAGQANATVITGQPNSPTVLEGATVTLTASAFGEPDIEWEFQENDAGTWNAAATGTGQTATISIGPVTTADDGRQFRAVFSSATAGDTAATNTATITVTGNQQGGAITDIEGPE